LIPLSQAILADIFPPEDRGKAMAIWGIGIMVGPILGPTLGGYLIDIANWRWTFYVNLPVGILTLLLANVIPDTPKKERQMDWLGLVLISLAIGGLQYVLDRGNQDDWFASTNICIMTYLCIAGFFGFILHNSQTNKKSVFDLRIFKDKNFTLASLMLAIFCLGMYGIMVTQPLMMEGLLNYPALTTGLVLAPRGISGMISMMIVGKLIGRIDPRLLILSGISLNIYGMWMAEHYSLYVNMSQLMWPLFIQGFGLGMVFVPLSTIAYATLPLHLRTEAAGLYSLLRTIGGSIGISIAITVFTRRTQFFWHELGGGINHYNGAAANYLHSLHLYPTQLSGAAILGNELYRQAAMLSFTNVFALIMWCFIIMIPLVLLLDKPRKIATIQTVSEH